MVGGSLLIVYEADFAKAEEGLRWIKEGGINGAANGSPPYVVKLIDFAHTRIKPGKGPDEGVLKGIDTTLSLLDSRIKEVEGLLG